MSQFSAVLLGAGESRRMEGSNKLLLSFEGQPLVARMLRMLAACRLEEIVVVLGHQAELVGKAVDPWRADSRVRVIVNEDYLDGQMSTVTSGIRALTKPVDGILICPADLPCLEARDIERLMAAFADLSDRSILVPRFNEERGSPIIISYRHRDEIAMTRNLGCRHLIANNPELVRVIDMDSDHIVTDVDTPAAYRKIVERLGKENLQRSSGEKVAS